MRLTKLKALELYATKSASRSTFRPTGPALLLDTRLWDLNPESGDSAFTLAPADAVRSGLLDRNTGARRGLLVVRIAPSTLYTSDYDPGAAEDELEAIAVKPEAKKIASLTDDFSLSEALRVLGSALPRTLVVSVLLLESLVEPLSSPKRYRCPDCGDPVGLDAADRVRSHDTAKNKPCQGSGTWLNSEQRKAHLIAPSD